MRHAFFGVAFAAGLFFACSSSTSSPTSPTDVDAATPEVDAATEPDASDAAVAVDASKPTGQCAATFGDKLTAGFGRIDGILYAVQKPSDKQCAMLNGDHVIVQVLMNGAVYRLVVNVLATGADTKIRIAEMPHALPAPAYAEGWHTDAPLDYLTSLGAHADASFTAATLDEGVTRVAALLDPKIGAPISIYGTSGDGRPDSAHLIHRNLTNHDGAIVVNPTTNPTFMLFHFATQTF